MTLKSARTWLCSMAFGLFALPALAQVDVSCFGGDCFTFGWEQTDFRTGAYDFISCNSSDCRQQGWLEYRADGLVYEYRCLSGGCFSAGYQIFDLFSGAQVGEVRCLGGNCHVNGSVLKDEEGPELTVCKSKNCSQIGWTERIKGVRSDVTCKSGGCFVNGWVQQF